MSRIFAVLLMFFLPPAVLAAEPDSEVGQALDAFHAAAARADLDTYLGLLTADAVFLGTDGSERWQGEAFRAFVSGHFSQGRGWTYHSTARQIRVGDNGAAAWFDELLWNEKLGQCRGSGVLLRGAQGWRIAQYNLSVPIPNELVVTVAQEIRRQAAPAGQLEPPGPDSGAPAAAPVDDTASTPAGPCPKRHKTNRRAGC